MDISRTATTRTRIILIHTVLIRTRHTDIDLTHIGHIHIRHTGTRPSMAA